ncbi:MAG: hypothetical protein IIX80_02520 [Clostridia bacterium]|nr:hypothetical protein [Clostridia bacterium]
MQEELDNLRKDAAVMRSILDRAALTATPQPTQPEKTSYIPKAPVKKTEDEEVAQLSAFDDVPTQPTAPVPSAAQSAEEPAAAPEAPKKDAKAQKPANKNRVGSMFDLLTFSDI